ncbi:MAG TPA: SDR family oxidoreductase [Steroidobacteraceae bacterium]|nr:SDR family oxidoreductase [Steroidobacteraceae bacterium]
MGEQSVALITGGSRGIGRAIVERLAADGFYVLFTYAAQANKADEAIRAVEANGGKASAVRCDLGDLAQCEAVFAALDKLGLPLKVYVNNAAQYDVTPISAVTAELFDRTVAVNLRAPFFMSRLAAARLVNGGRIIYISSLSEHLASPMYVSYTASKSALRALVLAYAQELGPRGITVNALCPGMTDTDMSRQFTSVAPEMLQLTISKTALNRIGQPEDLANAVAMFAGPDSAWITAQVIDCSGGYGLM